MIFGEFEWYTDQQIIQQVEVNMVGCFRIAKFFLPMLRKHKGTTKLVISFCCLWQYDRINFSNKLFISMLTTASKAQDHNDPPSKLEMNPVMLFFFTSVESK